MNHTISGYNKTGYEASTQTWNLIQSDVNNGYLYYLLNCVIFPSLIKIEFSNCHFQIECCGIYGPKDWEPVTHSNKLPTSCCYAIPLDGFCTDIESYKDGCFKKFESILEENSEIIIWTAIGFALIQVC